MSLHWSGAEARGWCICGARGESTPRAADATCQECLKIARAELEPRRPATHRTGTWNPITKQIDYDDAGEQLELLGD